MGSRRKSRHNDLWRGLIRLHVLHHAAEEDVYGLGLIRELRRHGYCIGPGTLYPMLHRLVDRGYLRERPAGESRQRRYYATAKGRRALAEAYRYVAELFAELRAPETRAPRAHPDRCAAMR